MQKTRVKAKVKLIGSHICQYPSLLLSFVELNIHPLRNHKFVVFNPSLLVIAQFNETIGSNYGPVLSTVGSKYYVRILSSLDRELLKPNTSIALHRHSQK